LEETVGIRDSKSPSTAHLVISQDDLAALISRIKVGQLDL
jgi:hypothetical protein